MDALRAEIKQIFVQICTISRHRRCIRYLILLTVKEFGLPLGEPHISAVSAISAKIIFTRRCYYVSQKAQITQKGF